MSTDGAPGRMTPEHPVPRGPSARPEAALVVFAFILCGVLAGASLLTPYPSVLSDEVNYLLITQYGYREENFGLWQIVVRIPSHLFYATYALLDAGSLYRDGKFLNAVFAAGIALPAWCIARRHLPGPLAVLFAASTAAAPLSTFSRYFMPETMYVFGFWMTVAIGLGALRAGAVPAACVTGLALGTLVLVKPHAVALLAGFAAFFVLRHAHAKTRVLSVVALGMAFIVTRALWSRILLGSWDYSLAFGAYDAALRPPSPDVTALLRNAAGHLAALVVLAGLPIVVVARAAASRDRAPNPGRDVAVLSLCILGTLVAMTVYYSTNVAAIDPLTERITRLHGRYYAWSLPLVLLAYLACMFGPQRCARPPSARALGLWAMVALVAFVVIVLGYETSIIDFVDLGVASRIPVGLSLPAFALLACAGVLGAHRRFAGGRDAARALVPVVWWGALGMATTAVLIVAPLTGKWFVPGPLDVAMSTRPELLALRGRDDVMVVGVATAAPEPYRVLFYLGSRARGRIVPSGSTLPSATLPPGVRVLLLLPGTHYDGPGEVVPLPPLRLIHLPP